VYHSKPGGSTPVDEITAWFALRFKKNKLGEETKH
jgi:hypothetical protein